MRQCQYLACEKNAFVQFFRICKVFDHIFFASAKKGKKLMSMFFAHEKEKKQAV